MVRCPSSWIQNPCYCPIMDKVILFLTFSHWTSKPHTHLQCFSRLCSQSSPVHSLQLRRKLISLSSVDHHISPLTMHTSSYLSPVTSIQIQQLITCDMEADWLSTCQSKMWRFETPLRWLLHITTEQILVYQNYEKTKTVGWAQCVCRKTPVVTTFHLLINFCFFMN